MLTRQDVRILEDQFMASVSFLVIHLFHGEPKSNLQFQGLLQKLNTGLLHLQHVNFSGSSIFYEI